MSKVIQKKPISDEDGTVVMPKIQYKAVKYVDSEKKFEGEITPIPSVLIEYLDKVELKVFAHIMRQLRENGACIVRLQTMGTQMQLSNVTIANATSRLRQMGFIYYENAGHKRNKKIDFDAIQSLNDLLKDMKPGAIIALRKRAKNKNVQHIPPTILEYIQTNFAYNEDDVENEEYE